MFLVSMLLPAVYGVPFHTAALWGWECAYLVCIPFSLIFDPMCAVYAVSNFGALFSPLVKSRRAAKQRTYYRIAGVFAILSGVHALRWAMPHSEMHLSVGYWVWMLSFFTLGAGFLLQSKTNSRISESNLVTQGDFSHPKTEAELAAERELFDYLRV